MNGVCRRGALIVFEGLDRSGKSTQCKLLVEALLNDKQHVELMRFPDRTTAIGEVINQYLTCQKDMDDRMIHLLFSANRWEKVSEMKRLLESGTTLIIDRYAYSGVAFSSSKNDLTLDWCCHSDIGLPKPDCVFFLELSEESAQARGGYGNERYENKKMQKKVYDNYMKLQDDSWKLIDADKDIQQLHQELLNETKEIIKTASNTKLHKLWTDGLPFAS